jgi:hypothetical protein
MEPASSLAPTTATLDGLKIFLRFSKLISGPAEKNPHSYISIQVSSADLFSTKKTRILIKIAHYVLFS